MSFFSVFCLFFKKGKNNIGNQKKISELLYKLWWDLLTSFFDHFLTEMMKNQPTTLFLMYLTLIY